MALGMAQTMVNFNRLIQIAAREGKLDVAEKWLAKALEVGLAPNIRTYNMLISAAGKAGNINAAEHWFEQVAKVGLSRDVVSYNTLIHAAMKAARPWQVEELFWKMLGAKLEPDSVTFRTMRWSVGMQGVRKLCVAAGVGWYGKGKARTDASGQAVSIAQPSGRFEKLAT